MADLTVTGKSGESHKSGANKSSFTRKLDILQNFIGLLTTVHFFSVPTAFATYFGVIQSDSAAQCTNQIHSTLELCHFRFNVFSPSSWTVMRLCFSCSRLTTHSRNIDKIEKGFHSLGLGRLYSGNCFPYYVRLACLLPAEVQGLG